METGYGARYRGTALLDRGILHYAQELGDLDRGIASLRAMKGVPPTLAAGD